MRKYTIAYSVKSVGCSVSILASSYRVAEKRFWENMQYAPIAPSGKPMWDRRSVKIKSHTSILVGERKRAPKQVQQLPMAA